MKALLYERNLPRFGAARLASTLAGPGRGAAVGPLRLVDLDPPELPAPGWAHVKPLLSGICGSDLATVDGRSSRYFEPLVSFPFVPGHEVVGVLEEPLDAPALPGASLPGASAAGTPLAAGDALPAGARVVLEPVIGCVPRAIHPPCPACATGDVGGCERTAFGALDPGIQIGYCTDTGGGWSVAGPAAHRSQVHPVPDGFTDEDAVMVEPTACAVHAALAAEVAEGECVAVIGAGTLGLLTIAALRCLTRPGALIAGAKHPHQRTLAAELGADVVAEPAELTRAVRRRTRSLEVGGRLTGGADVVVDCVGSAESLAESLALVRPRGRVVLVGMPGTVHVDLAPLWQREIRLLGAYAYGNEHGGRRSFDLAFDLVAEACLGRLVSAAYPLERYEDAIAHAATAGRRGATKIVFDLRARRRSS